MAVAPDQNRHADRRCRLAVEQDTDLWRQRDSRPTGQFPKLAQERPGMKPKGKLDRLQERHVGIRPAGSADAGGQHGLGLSPASQGDVVRGVERSPARRHAVPYRGFVVALETALIGPSGGQGGFRYPA